jgi:protein SCO1/2
LAALWRRLAFSSLIALASVGGTAAVQIGGPFALVDQHGATRTDKDFRGSYLLIYFGFTHCPDTCPTALSKMTGALEALAELDAAKAGQVVPIFISVDPERDTPAVLRGYVEQFDRRLVGLTGTRRELDKLGRAYGVFSAVVPTKEPAVYVMDHTSFLYLIGPDGKYVQYFESDISVDDLVAALNQSVIGQAASGSSDGPTWRALSGEQGARRWPRR